jgi:tetraacyldisaccharide 4'-kinase
VLAVAGVGAPDAFAEQLRGTGARVTLARFPDHHAYGAADARALAERAGEVDRVVTTLKDAVKLGPLWPDGGRALWYVTQRVRLEAGAGALAEVLDALAAAARRSPARSAPPPARPVRDF